MTDAPPRARVGAFELRRPIGKGGQGAVWQAEHPLTGTRVAIKVLGTLRAEDGGARAAFRREVRAAAGLDHPNIIVVLDQGVVDVRTEAATDGALRAGSPWLAMELARTSLASLPGPHRWADTRAVLTALLQGLSHAHARGVVHRDIKPPNILFMEQPRTQERLAAARLADFGLAFRAEDGMDPTRRVMAGTPLYMAPEQFGGHLVELGPWTDLYAVGWVGWELCAGHPMRGQAILEIRSRKCTGNLPYWPEHAAAPPGFGAWVRRLLELDPRQRYACAADALAALLALPDEAPEPVVQPVNPAPTAPTSSTTLDMVDAPIWIGPGREQTGATAPTSEPTWDGTDPVAPPPEADPAPARRAASLVPRLDAAPRLPAPLDRRWHRESHLRPPALQGAGLGLLGLRVPPLLGRDEACESAWSCLVQIAEDRRPRSILVEGGAGQGKTRFVAWMGQRCIEVGAAERLELSAGPRTPDPGISEMLMRRFGLHGLPKEDAQDLMARQLRHLGLHDRVDLLPLLELAGLRDEGHSDRAERRAALNRLVQGLARERPVLLLVDDAPHAAEALDWIRSLLDFEDLPLLVVLTARTEDLAEDRDRREALASLRPTVLPLPPLHPAPLREIVRWLLYLDEGLLTGLVRRAGGNPAFALQLLGDWASRDLLVPDGGGYTLIAGARPRLPDDLHEAWNARLERIVVEQGASAYRAVELAATLDMEVDLATWKAVCAEAGVQPPEDLVERLLDAALARPGDHPERSWSFAHGMLRESAQRRAAEEGREAINHAACAAVLDRLGAPDAQVGAHLAKAGAVRAALPRLLAGARERLQADALESARSLLDEARRAATALRLGPASPEQVEIALVQGLAALTAGRFSVAREGLGRLVSAGVGPGPLLLEATEALAMAAMGTLDLRAALASGQEALQAAREAGNAAAIRRLTVLLGGACVAAGQVDAAAAWFDEATQALAGTEPDLDHARVVMGRVEIARARRRIPEALALADAAIALLEGLGSRRRLAQVLNSKGDLLRYQGDLPGAIATYQRTERLFVALGTAYATGPRINLGLALLSQERFEEASQLLRLTLGEVRTQGHAGYEYAVRHALLPVAAAARDQAEFQRQRAAIADLKPHGHFVDADLAAVAEQAGDLWLRAWSRDPAQEAWALAEDQLAALKDNEGVERLRRKRGSGR